MTNLALVPSLPVEDTRTRKPNRRPGSCPTPSKVTEFHPPAAPDKDIPVVARWLISQGWSALDAFHAGFDADLAAAMWMLEASAP